MTTIRDAAGDLRTVVGVAIRDALGALRPIVKIQIRDADNVLRTVGGGSFGFSATSSPTSVVGNGASNSSIQVTTPYTTVSVTGGTPPYTYSWAGFDPDWEATDPTGALTYFRSGYLGPGEESETDFVCTVTDATSATADTNYVHTKARNRGFL